MATTPCTILEFSVAPTDSESDAELLRWVAMRGLHPARATAAQAVFYERHVRYLYGILVRRQRPLLDHAGLSAEDLVQETFQRAFERAHTFQDSDVRDPEQSQRRTRAWLGRIAHHLLVDALRGEREVTDSAYVDRAVANERDSEPPCSPHLALVHEGLARLSERERDVLRVTALYHRLGEANQRLPNEVSQELASRWGTTNQNVRAIRSRAFKKLSKFLSANGVQLGEAT